MASIHSLRRIPKVLEGYELDVPSSPKRMLTGVRAFSRLASSFLSTTPAPHISLLPYYFRPLKQVIQPAHTPRTLPIIVSKCGRTCRPRRGTSENHRIYINVCFLSLFLLISDLKNVYQLKAFVLQPQVVFASRSGSVLSSRATSPPRMNIEPIIPKTNRSQP